MKHCGKWACAAAGLILSGASAAADFSFSGTFNRDDDVQLFSFSVDVDSSVTMRSWGYAGGVNAAGQAIARGGFDTIMALFDGSGMLIDSNDDGSDAVAMDAGTGRNWDAFLQSTLAPGDYRVSLMQFDNFASGPSLADGFVRDGTGNYTAGFGCGSPAFCDISGETPFDQRDNHWAFDILNVNHAAANAVPEPGTYAMLLIGLVLLGFVSHRRKPEDAVQVDGAMDARPWFGMRFARPSVRCRTLEPSARHCCYTDLLIQRVREMRIPSAVAHGDILRCFW
jgi:PEP-CTERM motif